MEISPTTDRFLPGNTCRTWHRACHHRGRPFGSAPKRSHWLRFPLGRSSARFGPHHSFCWPGLYRRRELL